LAFESTVTEVFFDGSTLFSDAIFFAIRGSNGAPFIFKGATDLTVAETTEDEDTEETVFGDLITFFVEELAITVSDCFVATTVLVFVTVFEVVAELATFVTVFFNGEGCGFKTFFTGGGGGDFSCFVIGTAGLTTAGSGTVTCLAEAEVEAGGITVDFVEGTIGIPLVDCLNIGQDLSIF
jgi:hypothetical protein